MRCLVLVGSVLACVSSAQSTFDTGYGVPAAPVLVTRVSPLPSPIPQPILPASLPLTAQPVPFSLPPQPILAPAPVPLAQPLPIAPIAPVAPIVEPPSSQFHAQDEFGQFSFGYQNINSARSESKDAFGVTRGSYQYVDANNVVQTVHYTADDINGFRVAATNVPVAPAAAAVGLPVALEGPVSAPLVAPVPVVETPEVAAARAEHLAAHEAAKAEVAAVSERRRREAEPIEAGYGIPAAPVLRVSPVLVQPPVVPAPVALAHQPLVLPAPVPAPLPFAAQPLPQPLPVHQPLVLPAAAPLAHPLPVAPVAPIVEPPSSQFHAQDEFGQFSFGYQNINSARSESKDAFGVARGSYQYVDANGVLQTVNYISDDVNGFRVAATNVPVAPAAPAATPLVAPVAPEAAPLVAPVAVA